MKVLVTRPREQAAPLVEALERHGFAVVLCPLIEIEPIDDGPIDTSGYDWVIVTSANGARELLRRRTGPLPRLAAIGEATAAAVREQAFDVAFVPSAATQEALVAEFPRPPGRLLFVGAEEARRLPVAELGADFRAAYRTRRVRADVPGDVELAVVASPSAARALADLTARVPAVAIGPQTAAAARAAGLTVAAEARTQDLSGLVAAVLEAAR